LVVTNPLRSIMRCEHGMSGRSGRYPFNWVAIACVLGLAGIAPSTALAETGLSAADLDRLPIEDLAKIEVSSVSKLAQPLSDAPAAIYVITHDDIVRSGAMSLPEILRLAPNLQVAQNGASQYVITARGFSGSAADQNFSNKLLVLIDGRSVYTPLYSGVYWDMQNVLPEDIERIEVISGPGATLWGANAVNGVINIITRKSSETQGGLLSVQTGNLGSSVAVRFGGKINDDLTYRLYVDDFADYDTVSASGAKAHDNWSQPQGGFRFDWTPSAGDAVTLQGDAYAGSEAQDGAPNEDIEGRNLLARWNRTWQDGSDLQVQAYYDHTARTTEDDGGHFSVDTYDLDVQHSFTLYGFNQIVWGGGYRYSQYAIVGTPQLQFSPSNGALNLANVFVQDSVSFNKAVKLTAGLKLEDDPYSGLAVLPSVRLSWTVNDEVLLWAAASRAIRSPTPFDRDVAETLGSTLFLVGDPDYQPEALTAYEVGARVQPNSRTSFSVSAYYNVYSALRSTEFNPLTLIPLSWGNMMRGDTYGVEAWGEYRLTEWWRLSAGFNALAERLTFEPGSAGNFSALFGLPALGIGQAGDDPKYQASLKSSMNLGHAVTLDGDLRYVDALPDPAVPGYVELDARVGWKISPRVQLSLAGLNLLHDRHQELPAPALPVPRGVTAGLQWRF
jgi:iron complex outermembrane receptor protein